MSDEEKKELTATQVFAKYMAALDKVRALSNALAEKVSLAESLGDELSSRFGIHVSGVATGATTRPAPTPRKAPSDNAEVEGSASEYVPPTQHHAPAPTIEGPGSAEVAEIRREAGLSERAADSKELAASGLGTMGELQKSMTGTPTAVAIPGEHQEAPTDRSNAEGGPVTQKPAEEK